MSDHDAPIDEDVDRVEALLRELTAEDHERHAPPAAIWEGIAAGIASDRANASPEPVESGGAEIVSLDSRRRFSPRLLAGAAAAAAVVVVAGIVAVNVNGGTEPIVLAGADLAYDPVAFDPLGAESGAHVSLVDDDGMFRIAVDESDLSLPADESADLEIWLIEPDETGAVADLVSLGVVDPEDPGSFDVPAGYDPAVFSVVDISVEPRDGDDTHSGRSILRAGLDFA